LKLDETGELEGKLTVTYTGLEATRRRVEERLADETERKKFWKTKSERPIPIACERRTLPTSREMETSSPALVAEYTLKVTGWSRALDAALSCQWLFAAPEKHLFDHAFRDTSHLFRVFLSSRVDDVSIDMPLGWQIGHGFQRRRNLDAKAISLCS